VEAWDPLAVDIHGDLDGGVTHHLLDDLRVDATREHERRKCVPEVSEAVVVWDLGPPKSA
jgi:hypothetical protein